MALYSVLRLGLRAAPAGSSRANNPAIQAASSTIRLAPYVALRERRAGLVHKALREPKAIKPFPYETQKLWPWRTYFDYTAERLTEHSRIIVVEGNIGVGKSTLAKQIADEFDLLLFPEASPDMMFIDQDGFDLRSIEDKFPECLRPFDLDKFYANPNSKLVPNFQYSMMAIRTEQYCDAMAHVLNTGQGVVLERSVYSDFIFMNTLRHFGYVNAHDVTVYNEMLGHALEYLLKPHLVVYLDAPVDVLQQRIKMRGTPCEMKTKVLTNEYLAKIDEIYKEKYLPSIRNSMEMLIYDCTNFVDPEVVMEDIERIDFEQNINDVYSTKFADWKRRDAREWAEIRCRVTTEEKLQILQQIWVTLRFNEPYMFAEPEEVEAFIEAHEKYVPVYAKGFDPSEGILKSLFGMDLFAPYQRPNKYLTRYVKPQQESQQQQQQQ